ncbi:MAG: hypothetical protein ACO4AJ_03115 [Prochlorothrix sp.]
MATDSLYRRDQDRSASSLHITLQITGRHTRSTVPRDTTDRRP